MANTKNPQTEVVENEKLSFEEALKKYQTIIIIAVAAVLVVVFGALAINKWIIEPKQNEANAQMFAAEASFAAGDYEVALNGDGNNFGFADVIKEYKGSAAKSAYFYAGVCELQLGNNEAAISYLKNYKGKDKIFAGRAICCMGDAYANSGKTAEAIKCFVKAAKVSDNEFSATYLLKAGVASEDLGDDASALKYYQKIKSDYPNTLEGYDIDKYITRIQNK